MLGLGIDAGGTYTDTAIVDLDTGEVLSGNKALTTRNDLSVGIRESISGLDQNLVKDIALASLSSTLATNSVVEGKGCRVGLICIGKPYLNETAPEFYYHVDGRFQTNGEEEESLGVRQISEALTEMKGKVPAG